jgi:hypothetical protein
VLGSSKNITMTSVTSKRVSSPFHKKRQIYESKFLFSTEKTSISKKEHLLERQLMEKGELIM